MRLSLAQLSTGFIQKKIELAPRLLADDGLRSGGSRKPSGRSAVISRASEEPPNGFLLKCLRALTVNS